MPIDRFYIEDPEQVLRTSYSSVVEGSVDITAVNDNNCIVSDRGDDIKSFLRSLKEKPHPFASRAKLVAAGDYIKGPGYFDHTSGEFLLCLKKRVLPITIDVKYWYEAVTSCPVHGIVRFRHFSTGQTLCPRCISNVDLPGSY